MMDAIEAAYKASRDRLPGVSLGAFVEAMKAWEVHPVEVGGSAAGAICVRGPEIHALILPWAWGLWMGRKHLRILGDVMRKHGHAITRATTEQGRRFVEALGFEPCGEIYKKVM